VWFFLFERTFRPSFDIVKLIERFLGGSLGPFLPISQPFNFGFNTFFQIQEPLAPIQKNCSVPFTHYTFPNAKDYMGAKFYNKFKHGFM
jgi:hypothetical protein